MASIDLPKLREYEALLATHFPGVKVKFKDESFIMKALAFLAYPFSPNFSKMTTVLGGDIYFPSRAAYEETPVGSFVTLFHESVHLWDEKQRPLGFKLSYIFPQVLALLPMAAFAVLAWPHGWLLAALLLGYIVAAGLARASMTAFCVMAALVLVGMAGACAVLTGWTGLILFAAAACLVPWPAPFRAYWELRGYAATIAAHIWLYGEIPPDRLRAIREHFTGPTYYFMTWGSGDDIARQLAAAEKSAVAGTLQELPPYKATHDFLYRHGLLHR